MNRRLLDGVLLGIVLHGCSTGSPNDGGSAGTAGQPGSGGSGGVAGQAGSATGGTVSPGTGGSGAGGSSGGAAGSATGGGAGSGAAGVGGSGGAGGGGTGGAGGAAGTGGSAGRGAPDASGGTAGGSMDASSDVSSVLTGQSVLERNNHPSRDGHFIQPTLTKAAAARLAPDTTFAATFPGPAPGSMWASPLYLENGPGGRGVFFAVTTTNNVHALDETTGAVVWTKNIGASPTANGVACGNIHPLGILSTPVIDARTRTIYVAGAVGTTQIDRHEVHALSVDDGTERAGFPIDVSTIRSSDGLTFAPPPHNQRSALSLVNGTLYVAYGGHIGDCGPYHGWVFSISTSNPTMRNAWASGGTGEGIWAAGGLASDGTNVFAITGNRTVRVASAPHADSEQVIRLSGVNALMRTNANLYYPATWENMDNVDADFGANNPVFITVPGATPSNYVVAIAKDGHIYLLDSNNLGGMGGHVVNFVASTGSMSIRSVPGAYTTPLGVHVMFAVGSGAQCPAGGPTGAVVMSVLIPPGSPPVPRVAWCAPLTGRNPGTIATTTDGTANAVVWYMNGTTLTGVDGDTGAAVFSGANTACAGNQWTSPIAVKGRIVTAGTTRLCSWSAR